MVASRDKIDNSFVSVNYELLYLIDANYRGDQ